MEMQLVRTTLKERIEHLTKLILTSQTITAKSILDWNPAVSCISLILDFYILGTVVILIFT